MEDDKHKILNHYTHPVDKETASKVYDKANKVFEQQKLEITDFLDPHQVDIAERIINSFADISAVFHGGFDSSERKKVGIFPKVWNITEKDLGIEVLEIQVRFEFEKVSHRDVLGAVLGLGLKREKIGDIQLFMENNKVFLAVDREISQFICDNLVQIKNTSVSIYVADDELKLPKEEFTKEITGTVSSLRLDAVSSIGFGASRSKMNQLIKAERVKINWKPTSDPKTTVNTCDVISLRGKGRVEVAEVGGKSRKGRRHVRLRRYK
ncbi:RNA-binding protein [Natranaerobius trueperi]|uniref:RNA-binding S4 domain-containing protein n=1 Tax=Natranaerobius trueperi TaxID=759412 RepID=A0A226BYR9_9FIRM|nr:YlmH/Sll1252 family protein [Natranaerobius trueperi]OWZ84146.1 hypothetical protein CDO51_04560 [Natranaerobius trueperi]